MAGALAGAGQVKQGETLARSITHPRHQADALAHVAAALANAGHVDPAETVARSIGYPHAQAAALARVAGALAGAGRGEGADKVAAEGEPCWSARTSTGSAGAVP